MFRILKKTIILLALFISIANVLAAQDVILKKGRYISRENGKPYSGIYKEYDSGKNLISATSIKNGLLEDSTVIYYASGKLKEKRSYREGQKNGLWVTWDEGGSKTAEANFKNGRKDGFWFIWDEHGVKRYEMFYINGEKKGEWIIRDENGNIVSREVFN